MDVFQAIADPNRRAMIAMLAQGELAAGDIAARFAMSAPAVSQHLKTLRESGLVRVRPEGQRRIYALERGALREVDAWVEEVQGFWRGRLDALERQLAEDRSAD